MTEELSLEHFKFSVDDGVATVLMDVQGESMNVLSPKVSEDFEAILERVENDSAIRAVVVGSGKKGSFVAGADISVIQSTDTAADATRLAKELQAVFQRLEDLTKKHKKPVVAAIDGVCLGGGAELALACSARILSDSPKTMMGLPEVKLGLFPGAGGTQRLPHLIGVVNALDMILTGKNIRAKKALRMGLCDEVVPPALLLTIAKKRAIEAADAGEEKSSFFARMREELGEIDGEALQRFALEENPVGRGMVFKKAREELLKKTKGNYPGPEKAIEVIRIGIQEGLEAGYAAEADRFGQLVMSPEARALMSIFFATQELKKDNGTDNPKVKARPIDKIGVLGGGLMGGGIAAVSAIKAKTPARVQEVDAAGIGRAMGYAGKMLHKDVQRRRKSEAEATRILNRVTGTTDLSGYESIPLVIEAVFEDLELKRSMLRKVEEAGPKDVIFASNTSSLPITDIATASKHPETVIGMHYFSPVEKMPLLEIITTKDTADWVTATCVEVGKAQGKTVIVVRDGTGFYTSRILAPYVNEAAWLLAEGGDIAQLDDVMVKWGFPVGPVTLLDEVGIDVGSKVAKIMHGAFGNRMKAPDNMQRLIDDDRKGRKNGRGFYKYENGKKGDIDTTVYELFGHGTERIKKDPTEISQRLGLQMINEAALCLQEEILRNPRDGDIGAVFGLGFPPFMGGPFTYVDRVGAATVVEQMERLAQKHGERFLPAQILVDAAKSGKKFRN